MSIVGDADASPKAADGSSMLGIGTSAAATDARNCCVGALRLEATRLFSLNFGRGGEGGRCMPSLSTKGSGVLGCVGAVSRGRPAQGRGRALECDGVMVSLRGRFLAHGGPALVCWSGAELEPCANRASTGRPCGAGRQCARCEAEGSFVGGLGSSVDVCGACPKCQTRWREGARLIGSASSATELMGLVIATRRQR